MRKLTLLAALFALAFSSFQDKNPGKLKWERDYKKALELAKEQGKPVMMYFGFKT